MKPAACQLLTPVDDGEKAASILLDPTYAAQQKFDGKRIILEISQTTTAHNREGLTCPISRDIIAEARSFSPFAPITLDGEWLREINSFQAFDLLQLGGTSTTELPFKTRQLHLQQIFESIPAVRTLQPARTEYRRENKIALLQQIHDANLEGIVLKPIDSLYRTGRQQDLFKYKFTAVSSFVVIKRNQKQSVAIALFDETGKLIPSGDVKIRNSRFKLAEGMVIDVRYTHAFPKTHHISQPVMISVRDDLQPESCLISQLRYKGTKTAIII